MITCEKRENSEVCVNCLSVNLVYAVEWSIGLHASVLFHCALCNSPSYSRILIGSPL